MGIVVIGAVFVDIKGHPLMQYIPTGRNVGRVLQVHGGVARNIAEDIANYYVTSEQIPTVLSLGVLVAPDLSVQCAGGFLIQLLPFADESCIPILEKNIAEMPHFTEMLKAGMTAEDIVLKCLDGLEPNLLDEAEPQYFCDCSRERTSRILISIGNDELNRLAETGENIEVCCHFCDKKYIFTPEEILSLMKKSADA